MKSPPGCAVCPGIRDVAYVKVYAMKKYRTCSRHATLGRKIGYISDGAKTEDGSLVTYHRCGAGSAHGDFELVAAEYERATGAEPGSGRIAYQIIQSFRPGETDAATAHEIGLELAREFTGGNHQFVLATHVDTDHITTILFSIPSAPTP